jgi:hypothetical protein
MNKRSNLLVRIVGSGFLIASIAMVLPAVAYADDAKPCAIGEHRQFDYWLGNWSVSYGGPPVGTSKVELALDLCMIVESWDGARNHSGKTMFAYSPEDHSWYGMFADNEGHVHIFSLGKVAGGAGEFQGTSRGSNGETVLNRVKIVRVSADKVEQTWEKSTDNGSTWKVAYRGEYTRK